jgi:hypothetical protein
MEEVVQENMQIGPLENQEGDVAPKMNMDDVATYHNVKQEELEVTIKNTKLKIWRNIRNQLLK